MPLLVDHFLVRAAERHNKHIPGVEPEAFRLLASYGWPGNVRQLENEIERAVALTHDGDVVRAAVLSSELSEAGRHRTGSPVVETGLSSANGGGLPGQDGHRMSLRAARARFEADYIASCLEEHDGNVSRTAEALGVSRAMLHKKMKEYGLR